MLHLGSGGIQWPGWVSVDLNPKYADVVSDIRTLPFEDNYADAIAAIHVVEHIYRWEVDDMLKDWFRVLKPGGRIIIEVPCMEKVFSYIAHCMTSRQPVGSWMSWFPLWGDPKYKDPAMVHRWGYTYQSLANVLISAGFVGVKGEKPRYHFPQRDMRVTAIKPLTT